jgi:hypothetical protein
MKNLNWDAQALLESYTRALPGALDALDLEKRHALYRMLRLRVLAYPNGMLEVSGMFGERTDVYCNLETMCSEACGNEGERWLRVTYPGRGS